MLLELKVLITGFLFFNVCFAQNEIVFLDAQDKFPISNLAVKLNSGSIRFTNEKGMVLIRDTEYPISVRNNMYSLRTIDQYIDSVFLYNKYQELDEINVKPVDLHERYKAKRSDMKSILEETCRDTIRGSLYRYSMAFEHNGTNSKALMKQRYSILGIKSKKGKYDWYGVLEESVIEKDEAFLNYDTTRLLGLIKLLPSLNKSYLNGTFQSNSSKPSKSAEATRHIDKLEKIDFTVISGDEENPFIEKMEAQMVDSIFNQWSYSAGYLKRQAGFRWSSNEMAEIHQYEKKADDLFLSQSTIHEKWYIFSAENGGYGAFDFELDFHQFILWDVEMSSAKKWLPWNKIEYSLDGLEKGFVDFLFKSIRL